VYTQKKKVSMINFVCMFAFVKYGRSATLKVFSPLDFRNGMLKKLLSV
jgi:hypothetical protein